jgi:Mg-chelatase subunit ChlI
MNSSLRSDSGPKKAHLLTITASGGTTEIRRYDLADPKSTVGEVRLTEGDMLDRNDLETYRRSPDQMFKEMSARDEADRREEANRKKVEEEGKFLNRVKKVMLDRGFTESDFADLCREVYIDPKKPTHVVAAPV